MGDLHASIVALRHELGVTPADMVRVARCRPNVRPLARRAEDDFCLPCVRGAAQVRKRSHSENVYMTHQL